MGRNKKLEHSAQFTKISGLSHDGRGVGQYQQHKVFIEGALPGETVSYRLTAKRRQTYQAVCLEVIEPSPDRVVPKCSYFGICGGCSLQHYSLAAQWKYKHQLLIEALERLANVSPLSNAAPITAESWQYRRKARLGVRYVPKKGGVLVGFRERKKSYITSLDECPVLDIRLSNLLNPLHELIRTLSCFDRLPQIEVAAGDNEVALVFRHLQGLSQTDISKLTAFGSDHEVRILLQPGDLKSIHQIYPSSGRGETLYYSMKGLNIQFYPEDFIQVNRSANAKLVERAIFELEPQPDEQVLDLFCGVGNFSLPLATPAERVTGIEGSATLVERARANAFLNGINNIDFELGNLQREDSLQHLSAERYQKILLDPPRTGALEVIKQMDHLRPKRIVYVSCNPATLARDTGMLVHRYGYTLLKAGIIDMFPHTAHVESMALFERQ